MLTMVTNTVHFLSLFHNKSIHVILLCKAFNVKHEQQEVIALNWQQVIYLFIYLYSYLFNRDSAHS